MTATVHHEIEELGTVGPPSPRAPSLTESALSAAPQRWLSRYVRLLVAIDATAIALAWGLAEIYRNGGLSLADLVARSPLVGLGILLWLSALAVCRAYERRFLGSGAEEYGRVFNASVRFVAALALTASLTHTSVTSSAVAVALLGGTLFLLLGRYAARRILGELRRRGRCLHRVLLAGDRSQIMELLRKFGTGTSSGFQVIGGCTPSGRERMLVTDDLPPLPVVGSISKLSRLIADTGADTVALAASPMVDGNTVRRVSWELEGSGVGLVVAPGLVDVAIPRLHIRPVAGLPLLHVEEPEFSGGRRVLKTALERSLSAITIMALLPVLLAIAAAIAINSPGDVLYRQTRVGKNGRVFQLLKFRTMVADADSRLAELLDANEYDGLLFKMRDDPRVTRVGKWLRRWSLDELPQLFNVVTGDMALVGPRPQLPSEVAGYHADVHRRLLVKPGITGLWQVSGRANLAWDDTVRLDLYYVENWSLALDLRILWRTLFAVLKREGAY